MSTWRLEWVSPHPNGAAVADTWTDQEFQAARQSAQLQGSPYPVFTSPDGWPDPDLLTFATTGDLGGKARKTQRTYAIEIRVWLEYLHRAKRKSDWRTATVEDLRDYEYFRRRDRSRDHGRLILGTSFAKILAALDCLYEWAVYKRLVEASPVQRRAGGSGDRTPGRSRRGVREQQPTDQRRSNVRWLTRRAYERWRQIGFEDYGASGLPRNVERVRTAQRNVAFADYLYATGLRRQEGGGQLILELPDPDSAEGMLRAWVPAALGKGGKGRWFYLGRRHLRALEAYIRYDRHQAVLRAQAAGRYEQVPDRLILIDHVRRGRDSKITYRDPARPQGRPIREALNTLSDTDRMRLYRETDTGLEPLWLWLKEDGLPLPIDAWNGIFAQANARCEREQVDLSATPHMLRHSYALHMLIQAQYAYLLKSGLSAAERQRYQDLFGNVWELVRTLLGHASVETTKNWYLEPVRGLQLETLLTNLAEDTPVTDVDALMTLVSRASGWVMDVPEATA